MEKLICQYVEIAVYNLFTNEVWTKPRHNLDIDIDIDNDIDIIN
jgi:hypothetical protein